MFPIWFLPPNKLEKFPQTLNYISAFYKHSPGRFSFFSFLLPPPSFFKMPSHLLSLVLSRTHLLQHFCCGREEAGLPNPENEGAAGALSTVSAHQCRDPRPSPRPLSLGFLAPPLPCSRIMLLRTLACPLFFCQSFSCFTILVWEILGSIQVCNYLVDERKKDQV